jgi:hypothetical protein
MMSSTSPLVCFPVDAAAINAAHQLYCQMTGQSLHLAFDRERLWYELLRTGYSLEDLRAVITYLQREIRAGRRNVGAFKLSNLLQPDRFEGDLQISRVRLRPPPSSPAASKPSPPALCARQQQQGRERALEYLRQIKSALC